jgi:hypothetical protein
MFLCRTLPKDQDMMEAELANYAQQALQRLESAEPELSLVSIRDRMSSFDNIAVRETLLYVSDGIKELKERRSMACPSCVDGDSGSSSGSDDEEEAIREEKVVRQRTWSQQRQTRLSDSETAQLLV